MGLKVKTPNQNWLTLADIGNLLFLSGFDVYRTTRRTLLPVYVPVLSWFLNKYISQLPFFRMFAINYFSFARPAAPDAASTARYSVSVIVPARNESGNIENAILRLPKMGKETELIFVEGNSTDDTWEKIQEVQKKYADTHNIRIAKQDGKGKQDAVRKGFRYGHGRYSDDP